MNKKADNNAENQKLFKLSNKKLLNIKKSNSNKKTSIYLKLILSKIIK